MPHSVSVPKQTTPLAQSPASDSSVDKPLLERHAAENTPQMIHSHEMSDVSPSESPQPPTQAEYYKTLALKAQLDNDHATSAHNFELAANHASDASKKVIYYTDAESQYTIANDVSKAKKCYNEGRVAFARNAKNKRSMKQPFLEAAHERIKLKHHDTAAVLLQDAACCSKTPDEGAEYNAQAAEQYIIIEDYEKAAECLECAAFYSENPDRKAEYLAQAALKYIIVKAYEKAEKCFERAAMYSTNLDKKAEYNAKAAQQYIIAKDYENAAKCFESAAMYSTNLDKKAEYLYQAEQQWVTLARHHGRI